MPNVAAGGGIFLDGGSLLVEKHAPAPFNTRVADGSVDGVGLCRHPQSARQEATRIDERDLCHMRLGRLS